MPPGAIAASAAMLTWRAVAATPAQCRRTRSVNTPGQATVTGRMHRVVLVFLVLALAACGSTDGPSAEATHPVSIALDFTPNAVHAPLYMAGNALQIRKPGSGPDSLKLVSTGKVELGVLDIHDLAIAREQGVDLVAVGVLVGKPLAALITQPGVARPRDLEGRTVGVSGL